MVAVAFSTMGLAWLLTSSLRRTHLGPYKATLGVLVVGCAGGALACAGLGVPNAFIDWLVAFGFASAFFDGLLSYQSRHAARVEKERVSEETRLAEIDRVLRKMREE